MKNFLTFYLGFLLLILLLPSSTFGQTRDEMIEIFEQEAIEEGFFSETIEEEIETQLESYDWVIENATNLIFLTTAKEKWGNNYFMVEAEYQRQEAGYEWLVENGHENEDPQIDKDYYELMLIKEKEIDTQNFELQAILAGMLSLIFISFLQFLIFLKDMMSRKERIFFWLLIFLLTGPIGLTFYLSYRKLKEGEKREGRRLYHLSKNFMLPWAIYILGGGIIIMLSIIGYDFINGSLSSLEHFLEAIFWIGLIFVAFVIPFFILIPVFIAFIVMIITKTKKEKI